MQTAKLFRNGRSQAVRLPQAFRFEGDEVFIKKVGGVVLLIPKDDPWREWAESLHEFTDDFMATREQPEQPRRDEL
ncbi:type II toxin-antitoxin system antitoxin VapB [Deferrisoma sp.]